MKKDIEKIKQNLLAKGYSLLEVKKILSGLLDIENGDTYTAEQIHSYLLKKEEVYV